jgi:hypothetical protein
MISKHDLIFQQWVASLSSRDRTRNAIQGNFEELFLSLRNEGLILESAYEYLGKAIKAHEPTASLIRNVYKKLKVRGVPMSSEQEFGESWRKDIADKANTCFFEIFPVEIKESEEEDPVIYGSMTVKEYKAQRKHANEYPQLDTSELEKRYAENYNPVEDISSMLGRDSGSVK